jgi:hypothetical protein
MCVYVSLGLRLSTADAGSEICSTSMVVMSSEVKTSCELSS